MLGIAKWVNEQKQVYAGKRSGKVLREDQVRRLEEIGMEWGRRKVDEQIQKGKNQDDQNKMARDAGVIMEVLGNRNYKEAV